MCVCVCACVAPTHLAVSGWGGAEKKQSPTPDYMEKLTDDIFITFSTLPLLPKQN